MIIPKFWAEGKLRHRGKDRQVTVRRFGWSDVSQGDAQAVADRRADEALKRILTGEKLPPRDPKVSYNGAQGVPIREEIVAERNGCVITRNIYGARCLNTPDVLFADVDFRRGPSNQMTCGLVLSFFVVGVMVGIYLHSFPLGLAAVVVALLLGWGISQLSYRIISHFRGSEEKRVLGCLEKFLQKCSHWRVRVYRTPAGLRLLAIHRRFAPDDPEVTAFFRTVDTDPVYVRMCQNQQCFRARVTPKPWRIGIADHLKPRPGVWPINPEKLPGRRSWVDAYEKKSAGYAACHYVTTLGLGAVDAHAEAVQKLHDELSQAHSELPVA
jgi:hypothetical protein